MHLLVKRRKEGSAVFGPIKASSASLLNPADCWKVQVKFGTFEAERGSCPCQKIQYFAKQENMFESTSQRSESRNASRFIQS